MPVQFTGNVWSKRGRLNYFLSDHPEFRYRQIDTIEGIEIFDCTQLPRPGRQPISLWRWWLGFFLTFLLCPGLSATVGFVFGRPILELGLLPIRSVSESIALALVAGVPGVILSFLGCFMVLGYLQRLASLKILNQQTQSTLQRTGLIKTVFSSPDTISRGYVYKRVAWYQYVVDGVDHQIAGHHNVMFRDFPSAVADVEKTPWRTHRTVHYLSTDPGGVRHFNKSGGSPLRLLLGGPVWLAGLCFFLVAGACLTY